MSLSEQQKSLIVQILQTNIKKTRWVLDNKQLKEEKQSFLTKRISQMEEIIQAFQEDRA